MTSKGGVADPPGGRRTLGVDRRALFPLPVVEFERADVSHLSRGVAKRIKRREAIDREVAETTRCLNWLCGYGFEAPPRGELPRRHCDRVHEYLYELHRGQGLPEVILKPQEAARELLGRGPGYDVDGPPDHLGVYEISRLSLPSGGVPSPLLGLLDEGSTAWRNLVDERRLLLDQDEFGAVLEGEGGRVKPYWGPVLMGSEDRYHEFLRGMSSSGVLSWTFEPVDKVGVFFVKKKTEQLRVIIDARAPNRRFRRPPSMGMATGADLGRVDGVGVTKFCVSAGDIENAFYRMSLPHDLSRFFCL